MLVEMVKEIAESNRDAHADIIKRIECIKTHCSLRESLVDKQIEDAIARQRPFEMGVKTIGKFVAGMIAYTSLIVGIATAVTKLV